MTFAVDPPPAGTAGKNLPCPNPRSMKTMTSDAVAAPGKGAAPLSSMASSTAGVEPGLTRNSALAWTDAATSAGVSIVPAPTTASGTSATMHVIDARAHLVRSVTSRTVRPPATRARASGTATASSSMTMTGITGARLSRSPM